jgi:anthranilate phosphoribosyltransferase
MIAQHIRRIVEGESLGREEMYALFGEVMDGRATEVQKAALLIALRMKRETPDEITGAAMAMRARVTPLGIDSDTVIDTCGTGGDGRGTFNISTLAAVVAAAAGALVAKHGNRAGSSACGSADLLRHLGANIDLDAAQTTEVLTRVGMAFLFAPRLHPAMGAVGAVRRELGMRTIFNVLGPLTNPAFARRQVMGVYTRGLVEVVAEVLRNLGAVHAMVVHSHDGLDEISVSAPTVICELRNGTLRTFEITPEELGLARHDPEELRGGDAAMNAGIAAGILAGEKSAGRDIVLANAAAALYVGGLVATMREGVQLAASVIDSGEARRKLESLIAATNAVGSGL